MDVETQNPPPPPYTHHDTNLSQIIPMIDIPGGPEFSRPLVILEGIDFREEANKGLSHQLRTLVYQALHSLDTLSKHKETGIDVSEALVVFEMIFEDITLHLKVLTMDQVETPNQSQYRVEKLECEIARVSEALATQMRETIEGGGSESMVYREELLRARERDRQKRCFALTAGSCLSLCSMEQSLKVIYDTTIGQKRASARQTLAVLRVLAEQPAPPLKMLDQGFVTIGTDAIHRGPSYDIFKGEYITGEQIAVKVLRHRVDADIAKRTQERFARELMIWSSLQHDTILPLYGAGVIPSSEGDGEFQLYAVSPYLQNQDVAHYLKKHNGASNASRLQLSLDIARGLKYMHSGPGLAEGYGLVHSTLNISNILVKDSGHAVISDFGLSKLVGGDCSTTFTSDASNFGTSSLGPEMQDSGALTCGSDIWAWAMTVLEILTDEPPFGRVSRNAAAMAQNAKPMRENHPKIEGYGCRNEIWQLLEECWRMHSQDRPTASEVAQRLHFILASTQNDTQADQSQETSSCRNMSAEETIGHLRYHNCADITLDLRQDNRDSKPHFMGGFSKVYRGHLHDGMVVAIKVPNLKACADEDTRGALKSLAEELSIWSILCHENVLELLGLALFREHVALVSPWMDNGTVMDYIRLQAAVDRYKICMEVAAGLAYLHQNGSVHGDLKGENVLVSKDGIPKISHLGTSALKQYTLGYSAQITNRKLSLRWTAPELFEQEGHSSPESDVYALGMTILEIATGDRPYGYTAPDVAVFRQIMEGITPQRPTKCILEQSERGDRLWALLLTCWKPNPEDRATAVEVELMMTGTISINHPGPVFASSVITHSDAGRQPRNWGQVISQNLHLVARYFLIMIRCCV